MSTQNNTYLMREDYQIAYDTFINSGKVNMANMRMLPGDIRVEQPLVAAQNSYTFPVLVNIQNQGQPFPTEIRLQQQDSLCVTHIGFFLAPASGTTDCTFRLATFPNPSIFAQAVQLNTLYQNGKLNLTIDNDIYLKQLGLIRFWHSSETQQTAAPGAGSPVDELDGGEDGFIPMTPMIVLTGASDIQLSVNMNLVAPTAVDANSRMVIILRGFLAQMSTVIK